MIELAHGTPPSARKKPTSCWWKADDAIARARPGNLGLHSLRSKGASIAGTSCESVGLSQCLLPSMCFSIRSFHFLYAFFPSSLLMSLCLVYLSLCSHWFFHVQSSLSLFPPFISFFLTQESWICATKDLSCETESPFSRGKWHASKEGNQRRLNSSTMLSHDQQFRLVYISRMHLQHKHTFTWIIRSTATARQACGMKGCSCTCEFTSRISTKPGNAEGRGPLTNANKQPWHLVEPKSESLPLRLSCLCLVLFFSTFSIHFHSPNTSRLGTLHLSRTDLHNFEYYILNIIVSLNNIINERVPNSSLAPWWMKQPHLVIETSGLPKLDRQLWSLPWHLVDSCINVRFLALF